MHSSIGIATLRLINVFVLWCGVSANLFPSQAQEVSSLRVVSTAVVNSQGQIATKGLATDSALESAPVDSVASEDLPPNLPIQIGDQDEIWKINGRSCHFNPGDLGLLSVSRMKECHWTTDSLENLLAAHRSDHSKVTVIYVHGDRTDDYWAVYRGLSFYRNVFNNCLGSRPNVRFVLWNWRSEKQYHRPSRDFVTKSCRACAVGKSLGHCLAQFSDRRIVMIGYSLGCQAFLVALDEMANCSSTCTSNTSETAIGGYRVCLIAPALEPHYVSARLGCCSGSDLVFRTDIFDNTADRALKCARVLGWRAAPGGGTSIQVLAFNGNLPISNISLFDLACPIGKQHNVTTYSAEPTIGFRLREMVSEVQSFVTRTDSSPTTPATESR